MASPRRYPLTWPLGWPRADVRQRAKFCEMRTQSHVRTDGTRYSSSTRESLTVGDAVARLSGELRRLGVGLDEWLISSNLKLRLDGLPISSQANPTDPGVAVYFRRGPVDQVLACDAWDRIADNIAAIAAHIECLRGIDRYRVGNLDQAFAGYVGLPAKGHTWRTTLGFAPDAVVDFPTVERAFRERARVAHPDIDGGSHDAMASLTAAKEEARQELTR